MEEEEEEEEEEKGGGSSPTVVESYPAALPEGHYNVVYTGEKLGLRLRFQQIPQGLFVADNSGEMGPLPEVNDVVVSINGTNVHSHLTMDSCKFTSPLFFYVLSLLFFASHTSRPLFWNIQNST